MAETRSTDDDRHRGTAKPDYGRIRLVAIVAGQVASGFTANHETSGEPPDRIARWSVDIAKRILALAEEETDET